MIWTPSEIDQLISSYSIWPPDLNALSLSIGRSKASIKMKAKEMGLAKGNTLTDFEKEYIRKYVATSSISQVSRDLKRSQATILKFVRDNNLQVKIGSHNKWIPTESELEMIKGSSWNMMKELSEKIGRSIPLIRRQMRLFGIVKPVIIMVKRERKPRPSRAKPKIKPQIQAPRNIDGENRIREAIARLGLNK